MKELRQSKAYAAYMHSLGWQVEASPTGMYAYLKRIPLIPLWVMKIQRVSLNDVGLEWLIRLMGKYKLLAVYVELLDGHPMGKPTTKTVIIERLNQMGFRKSRSGMLPTKTLLLSLTNSEEEIMSEMKAKTRYNVRLAQRKGLVLKVLSGSDLSTNKNLLSDFLSLLAQNVSRLGLLPQVNSWVEIQLEVFGDEAYVSLVFNKRNKLLACSLYLTADNASYYAHNGSIEEGRRLMAPTLSVWEGVLEAKRRSIGWLDFDGLYDKRFPIKRFQGFSRFKKGFGGTEVNYSPAYVYWVPFIRKFDKKVKRF